MTHLSSKGKFGQDRIVDFRFGNDATGSDVIDLSSFAGDLMPALGSVPFEYLPDVALAQLLSRAFAVLEDHISVLGGNSVIDVGAALGGTAGINAITVSNVIDLTVDDFAFF